MIRSRNVATKPRGRTRDSPGKDPGRRLVAEFIGAAFLLATVVGSRIMAETLSPDNVGVALVGNTLATATMLVVLIVIYGPVSGAHFNPAVTLVFTLRRDITMGEAAAYIVVQVASAVAAPYSPMSCSTSHFSLCRSRRAWSQDGGQGDPWPRSPWWPPSLAV